MTTGPLVKTFGAMAALLVVLTACGRKGPLETPGVTATPVTATEAPARPVVKEKRFILDGLLE